MVRSAFYPRASHSRSSADIRQRGSGRAGRVCMSSSFTAAVSDTPPQIPKWWPARHSYLPVSLAHRQCVASRTFYHQGCRQNHFLDRCSWLVFPARRLAQRIPRAFSFLPLHFSAVLLAAFQPKPRHLQQINGL